MIEDFAIRGERVGLVRVVDADEPERMKFEIRDLVGILMGEVVVTPGKESPKMGEIAYGLSRDFWGGGYMTEAITLVGELAVAQLGFTRLWAEVSELKELQKEFWINAVSSQWKGIGGRSGTRRIWSDCVERGMCVL